MAAYNSLDAWKTAYPYIANGSTGIKLGDYEDARRKFQDMWARANPYSGTQPDTNASAVFSPASWEQGWTPTANDYEYQREYADWERSMEEAWGDMLTPGQASEYATLRQASSDYHKRLGQLGALAAFGGVAGLGALGAGMIGAGTTGAGAVGAEGLAAADAAGGLLPEFGTSAAYEAGLGTYALPVAGSTAPAFADLPASVMSGLGGDVGAGGWMDGATAWGAPAASAGGSTASGGMPGFSDYYTGHGGVEGSIAGSGVTNPGLPSGFSDWYKSLTPDVLKNLGSILGSGDSLIKGLYSLYQSNKLSDLGKGTLSQQTANTQLNALLKDPSQIYNMPGWKAGLQAVERTGAGQGYLGSGNMMIALNKYGGDFYNNTLKELNAIASGGEAAQVAYNTGSADLFGQGLNSIGYWLSKWGSPTPKVGS